MRLLFLNSARNWGGNEKWVALAAEHEIHAAYLGIDEDPIWRILDHYFGAAFAREDSSGVRAVGIDETARAWRLKEALRAPLKQPKDREEAEQALQAWYSWARRCRLEPFKRLDLTLKAHWQGILNAFDSRLSNGAVEGMNAQILAAKARARGLRTTRNLITVCFLVGGKLTHLPALPYGTTCRLAAA